MGSLCALTYARRGARVALFEANPNDHSGLKGEWLHPPASQMLQQVGVRFDTQAQATNGFVVFPEDGSEPIALTYPDGSHGLVCPHETLVSGLREAAENEPDVDLIWSGARPTHDGSITYTQNGAERSVTADRIVGADGRGSLVLRLLGLTAKPTVCSRMIGIRVNGVSLPMEDYGHIFCGGPGPIFMYRLGKDSVSAIMDIPREYSDRNAADLPSPSGRLPTAARRSRRAAHPGAPPAAAYRRSRRKPPVQPAAAIPGAAGQGSRVVLS